MKKIILSFVILTINLTMLNLFLFSQKSEDSQKSTGIVGVWKGKINRRHYKTFEASIGIRKVANVYEIRGVSKDQRIIWFGKGTLNGNILEYTYRIRNTGVIGKSTLTLSNDGTKLAGKFEEGATGRKRRGTEEWNKIVDFSKEQAEQEADKKTDEPKKSDEEKPKKSEDESNSEENE